MLDVRDVVRGADFAIADVHCSHRRGHWGAPELAQHHALVLARQGTFRRRVSGRWTVLDANVAYFQHAGHEQQIAHPHDGGDRCMSIELSPALVADLAGDRLPQDAFATCPTLNWHARLLLARALAGTAAGDLEEDVITVAAAALATARHDAVKMLPSRARLAAQAREAVAADPTLPLAGVARALDCSADHLSRAFVSAIGQTYTAYRRRLRVRLALERIADGETNLARVAAELGFADHPHLTRSIHAELGLVPTRVRGLLGTSDRRDAVAGASPKPPR